MIWVGVLGAVFGLLLGLAICYYRQLKAVAQNTGKIGAVAGLVGSVGTALDAFGVKF